MMAFCSQLGLLLWKNWILQKRRICVSIFEIIFPVFFATLILLLRVVVSKGDQREPKFYKSSSAVANYYDFAEIGYVPDTPETSIVMQAVLGMLQNRRRYRSSRDFSIMGFETEDIALKYRASNASEMGMLVVFDGMSVSNTTLPKNLNVYLRPRSGWYDWRTGDTFQFLQMNRPRFEDYPPYWSSGFNFLQVLISEAIAKYWVQKDGGDPNSFEFDVYLQRMPYPSYYDDPLIGVLQGYLPLFLILSFIISVIINVKNLVYEKERKLKESMKLMGLKASVHWVAWFITFTIYLFPALALYALLLGLDISHHGPVLALTDASLFFVFLLCYGTALITFCFMVSTFVQKANFGAAIGGVLFFCFYFPWYYVGEKYEAFGRVTKLSTGLSFNCAMALGCKVIGIYEGIGEGAQWSNFHKPAVVDDNVSLLDCMLLLLFDSLIHCIITYYVDNVRPGEFGVPKPFYFPFTKTYWFGYKASSSSVYEFESSGTKHFEKDPTGLSAGIQISKLRKVFGKKVAVNGASLNMYDNQITVLLGHNGAGKTTTMSMLTGFIPPTSGTAQVNGCDIRKDIQGVRKSLGLCPQHNILFDSLTVKEHLIFFAKLKGVCGAEIDAEVIKTVKEVGLDAKLNDRSQGLSGGQKRKLSVGIALIGGSKIVILDEPTSGMDPAARRQTWNVLQQARQNRTVVLSTHYMDEADLLGDRIAIMAEGVIKCCGSSMFLKKLYGAGYHLVVVKLPDCNVDSLTSVVQSHIPTAELESVINTEVSYILPDSESARFPALFTELDDHKDQLGIFSFGTSATTMEEVFLKVGESAYDHEDADHEDAPEKTNVEVHTNSGASALNEDRIPLNNGEGDSVRETATPAYESNDTTPEDLMAFNKGFQKNTGLSLSFQIIRALFVKKAIHTWRSRVVTLIQLVLPVFFLAVGMPSQGVLLDDVSAPPLTLDLKAFGQSYIPYTLGLDPSAAQTGFAALYKAQFGNTEIMEKFSMPPYDMNNYTLERASELGVATYNKKMIIGMESLKPVKLGTLAAVAVYNGQPLHAKAISVNYLVNTLLQTILDDTYSLQTINAPLPKASKKEEERKKADSLLTGFLTGCLINFGMAFLTSLFVYFLIKERQVGAKHLQVVSGVGPVTYWLPTFLWDFINYIVPCLLLLIVFAAYSKAAYVDEGRLALVMFVLVTYGWAVLPFMYALQFVFKSPPTGAVMMIILNIISGMVALTVVLVLSLPGLDTEDLAKTLDYIFKVLFPNYNMASCFSNIFTTYLDLEKCKNQVSTPQTVSMCCKEKNYMAWDRPGIGSYLFFMACQGLFYLIIVMFVEYHVFEKLWYLIKGALTKEAQESWQITSPEDSDVAAERDRVTSVPVPVHPSSGNDATDAALPLHAMESQDSLLLVNLYKRFGNFVAVDHICVGVPNQECFGLLGHNGAGKTTTFKMLTGDVMVTDGNAYLKGYDVHNNIKKVQANMGYCPQFDALLEKMTGRETLVMYARLRGVPESSINDVVNTLINILMLKPHADKLTGQYSGGNKRKLSTAMAIIGDPPFIMLDEPSCGMDPKARRQLWNVLSQVRASGRTLVLTSHSMEECDALCTRIAIMVNGKFVCLGSPQHLKNKFGQGYTLIVQMGALADGSTAPNQPVYDFIGQNFPGTTIFDDQQGYIHFQVPDAGVKLAQVFSLMESAKGNLGVQDYSVHQTTLEQVFLTFARAQAIVAPRGSSKCCGLSCF